MWICNKCETYNEDQEQFCCICNAKKSQSAVPAQQKDEHGSNAEITPSARITETIVRPSKPSSDLMRGSRDDLLDPFGMSGDISSKKITFALIAVNAVLLLANILGRFFMLN